MLVPLLLDCVPPGGPVEDTTLPVPVPLVGPVVCTTAMGVEICSGKKNITTVWYSIKEMFRPVDWIIFF